MESESSYRLEHVSVYQVVNHPHGDIAVFTSEILVANPDVAKLLAVDFKF